MIAAISGRGIVEEVWKTIYGMGKILRSLLIIKLSYFPFQREFYATNANDIEKKNEILSYFFN